MIENIYDDFDFPDGIIDIKCPECEGMSPIYQWEDCEIGGCELCGEHQATECPNCGERFDTVWPYTLENANEPHEERYNG
ncbi:MAG TPA: hypothetical protein ENI23_16655 [bacterium]|nr:hypothetical protein [bacterium]